MTIMTTGGMANIPVWIKSYPPEMPAMIGPLAYQSIGELIETACRKYPDRAAFSCMGKTINYADLERLSSQLGAWLQGCGLAKGDRVAIVMPNILQNPVAIAAVLRAGFVVVNANPLYTPRELNHQLKDSGAKAIIALENFAHTIEQALPGTDIEHICITSMGDLMGLKGHLVNFVVRKVKKMVPAWSLPDHTPFKTALALGKSRGLTQVDVSPQDTAFLQYTGGTTGISKGAMLLHSNVLSNTAQIDLWLQAAFINKPRPEALVMICALPLYHIFALTVNALMGMNLGAHNILIPNPRDIPAFVKELGNYKFHVFPGLNTLFNALLHNADFRKLDFSHLLLTFGGGMSVQRPIAERWQEVTGSMIFEGYGLSETSPVATANRFDVETFSGTIGLPLPSTEVEIRDEEGNTLDFNEVGEICIRGPQVMAGYWKRPDETAKVMSEDGFFRSGDMGFMDEKGYTTIVDRKKDMILVSGFNVYPNEIEEVAMSHPGVLEAACIGIADRHSGESVKLFIVKKDKALTEADVRTFCAQNLTNYKRPRHIEFRSELPKTNVGKILRRELRDESK